MDDGLRPNVGEVWNLADVSIAKWTLVQTRCIPPTPCIPPKMQIGCILKSPEPIFPQTSALYGIKIVAIFWSSPEDALLLWHFQIFYRTSRRHGSQPNTECPVSRALWSKKNAKYGGKWDFWGQTAILLTICASRLLKRHLNSCFPKSSEQTPLIRSLRIRANMIC
jgi:hypothetical protein